VTRPRSSAFEALYYAITGRRLKLARKKRKAKRRIHS
jgi:hypothetical protein